jgi:hypothetical protein
LAPHCAVILKVMSNLHPRSAGVTAAATLAILISSSFFLIWIYFFVGFLGARTADLGKHLYEIYPAQSLLFAIVPPLVVVLGVHTGIGLFQLRPWARVAALILASTALALCLAVIAFRPFETFFIPSHFVSSVASLKQLIAISFVVMLLPISVWWLFFFRMKSVKRQFLAADTEGPGQESPSTGKS